MKYSVCIEMLYDHVPWYDRFQAAADDGFQYAEFWRWSDTDWDALSSAVKSSGIGVSAYSGDDQFSPADPKDSIPYISFLKQSLEKAKQIGCPYLVIHSDALDPADGSAKPIDPRWSHDQKQNALLHTLKEAASCAEKYGITLVLEPLNTLVDHPGYFLSDPDESFRLVRSVGSEHLKVLFDIYHMQIMKGNVTDRLVSSLDVIGYVHAADVPGRHEPGTGELNYRNIFTALKQAGYTGFIGFELSPLSDTPSAVRAMKEAMV